MKLFVVFLILFGLTRARPELPSSYQYNPPSLSQSNSNSYNIPSNSYDPPSAGGGSSAPVYGPPSQAPIIHKHVYVHVPPPEQDITPQRRPIAIPPPQKHYKIVFIKAPTAPAPTAPVIPIIPQNEEKTLVYVLVKKPDDQPDIVIPTPAPTQPSKPEVYFIRYKTQKQETGGYPASIPQGPSGEYGVPGPSLLQNQGSDYSVPR